MKNTRWYVFILIVCFPVAFFLSLLAHEASHAFAAMLCGCNIKEFSIGVSSSVGAYVDYKYISVIAMSALVLPLMFPLSLLWIKFKNPLLAYSHYLFWGCFCVLPLTDNIMNLCAIAINSNVNRESWDLLMAYDSSTKNLKVFYILLSVVCATIAADCVYYTIRRMANNIFSS